MKAIFQLAALFFALAYINEVQSDDSIKNSEQSKPVFFCESIKEEAQGFKTAKNCKMSDGTIANVMFKKSSSVEIIVGQ